MLNTHTHTFVTKFYEGIFLLFFHLLLYYALFHILNSYNISYKPFLSLENQYILMVENTEKYMTKNHLTPSTRLRCSFDIFLSIILM